MTCCPLYSVRPTCFIFRPPDKYLGTSEGLSRPSYNCFIRLIQAYFHTSQRPPIKCMPQVRSQGILDPPTYLLINPLIFRGAAAGVKKFQIWPQASTPSTPVFFESPTRPHLETKQHIATKLLTWCSSVLPKFNAVWSIHLRSRVWKYAPIEKKIAKSLITQPMIVPSRLNLVQSLIM